MESQQGWIKSEQQFPKRRVVFTVRSERLTRILNECKTPDELEQALANLVKAMRPGLAGCALHFMRFDPYLDRWEIAITHGSLPAVSDSTSIKGQPLIEDEP